MAELVVKRTEFRIFVRNGGWDETTNVRGPKTTPEN